MKSNLPPVFACYQALRLLWGTWTCVTVLTQLSQNLVSSRGRQIDFKSILRC